MRFWIVSLSILHLSLTAQNAATQYANITITINGDATKSVTMAASQQTVYAAYNDSQAYILVPTVTKTLTGLEIESAGKIDLDFSIQVRRFYHRFIIWRNSTLSRSVLGSQTTFMRTQRSQMTQKR